VDAKAYSENHTQVAQAESQILAYLLHYADLRFVCVGVVSDFLRWDFYVLDIFNHQRMLTSGEKGRLEKITLTLYDPDDKERKVCPQRLRHLVHVLLTCLTNPAGLNTKARS
jgi:hypothetical protein